MMVYTPGYLLPARHAERPQAGLFLLLTQMNGEPPVKRAVVLVDGQKLFHAAREAFGYTYPNYDVAALAEPCPNPTPVRPRLM